jgi:hypothetical protein
MSFQPHPALSAAPGFPLGAVVSFCVVLATVVLLLAVAAEGVGLVGW